MKEIRHADDIFREREEREREEHKKKIVRDIDDVIEGVIKRRKKGKKINIPFWAKLLKPAFIIALFLIVAIILLGGFWLLKFLVKDLFFGG